MAASAPTLSRPLFLCAYKNHEQSIAANHKIQASDGRSPMRHTFNSKPHVSPGLSNAWGVQPPELELMNPIFKVHMRYL